MYTLLDSVLLGFLADETAVGLYTAGIKLTKIAIPFIISLGTVLIPKLTKNITESNFEEMQRLLDESFHFISFFSVPVATGLMVLAPECIIVFSGRGFTRADSTMQILSWLPVLIGLGYFFAFQILLPAGRNREMFLAVVAGLFVGLLLNFILVPSLKEKGAAIANVSCELVITVVSFYFVRKYHVFKYRWELLFKALGCSLLFIPVLLIIRLLGMNVVLSLFISVVSGAGVYFCAQYFLFKDRFIHKVRELVYLKLNLRKIN
jgi:O-antigen/teichoic acid export membrane protein